MVAPVASVRPEQGPVASGPCGEPPMERLATRNSRQAMISGCRAFAAPDRETVIRVIERQVEVTGIPRADVVDPDPDPIPGGMRDLDPLATFASHDEH